MDVYTAPQGYSDEIKALCLKMYVNGMGFRGIERVTGVHHTTVIYWVKQVGKNLPDAYEPERIPEVGELDELETFVGSKKTKSGSGRQLTTLNRGILGWVLGDHTAKTFAPLWAVVATWLSYFYVTDGWSVYPGFIPAGDQIVSKTYMTRVEGENTRLRHYLARLHRKTLCYSKSEEMLRYSFRLLLHYLKFWDVPIPQ
ncbi:IS1 family transposase [Trichocoleus sp. FACHB-69]|uniref:IS1 family transposase n=1 Tax=Cyanophyceae TaxID=3028117 RepID=UPI0037DC8963